MKRYVHAGEGYSLSRGSGSPAQPQMDKVFSLLLCAPKVTGIHFLVALFCSMLQHGSRIIRIFLADPSSPSRSVVEAASKNCRRSVEQTSKKLANNPLKIQKSICSALAGIFSFPSHYVSFGGFTLVKPRANRLWARVLCGCLSVFLLCMHCVVAKEADRGGVNEYARVDSNSWYSHVVSLPIGEKIQESLWDLPLPVYNHPEGRDTITLREHQGKLIILDFWASWCGSCIINFPALISLKEQYGDRVEILLVNSLKTRDTMPRIEKVFADGKYPGLTTVLGDDYFHRLFPHRVIPCYVWLGYDGALKGITSNEFLTEAKLVEIIEREEEIRAIREGGLR